MTPGQAAYEATVTQAVIDGHGIGEYPAYDRLEPWQRRRWEAGAQAVADIEVSKIIEQRDGLHERIAELVTEGNELRAEVAARSDRLENLAVEWGKRAKVARNRSAQTAGHTAERYDECADMLEHCAAGLRRAAGSDTPAADLDGVLSDSEEPYPPPDEIASLDTDVMEDP